MGKLIELSIVIYNTTVRIKFYITIICDIYFSIQTKNQSRYKNHYYQGFEEKKDCWLREHKILFDYKSPFIKLSLKI